MILRKRKRAEEADAPRAIDLIFAPVPLVVSKVRTYSVGLNLLFVRGQVLNFKASSVCPVLLAAPPRLQVLALRSLEGDFPDGFGYDD